MGYGNRGRTIFCHFSFKRPKGKGYGLFAVAFYTDFEGKNLITYRVSKHNLWVNHQFITAVQSYENALREIQGYQGLMRDANIRQVMLVTDNSTLAGWIENPNKNKNYTKYMQRAVKQYRVGEPKEITIGVGLCEPRKSEKSYKYCKEENVSIDYTKKRASESTNKLVIGEYKTAVDIVKNDISKPEISGIEKVI